jgi:hypothetical protein
VFKRQQPEISEQTIELIVERVLQRIVERAPTKPLSERERCPQLYRVLDFLDANPTSVNLTLRELELLTGVSKSYALRARRQWLAMQKKKEP